MLHLLGFDHELSDEAEAEMEDEEERLLKSLGWKGKGLIQSASTAEADEQPLLKTSDGISLYADSCLFKQLYLLILYFCLEVANGKIRRPGNWSKLVIFSTC